MSKEKSWEIYLANLEVGDSIEIEHLEFAFSPANTADRILCLDKTGQKEFVLSIQSLEVLALAEDYSDPEDYENGIDGKDVRMRLGEYLVGYDKDYVGGEENICTFAEITDPNISEYLFKNGWGDKGICLHDINLPDAYGCAWNL